jgi:hypothetical protein
MQIQGQLTSGLPWIATFTPTIEHKFKELNSALGSPQTNLTETVCLTREAVEEIAFNEQTPSLIAGNFLDVLCKADSCLAAGVPPYKLFYVLNSRGLKLVGYER